MSKKKGREKETSNPRLFIVHDVFLKKNLHHAGCCSAFFRSSTFFWLRTPPGGLVGGSAGGKQIPLQGFYVVRSGAYFVKMAEFRHFLADRGYGVGLTGDSKNPTLGAPARLPGGLEPSGTRGPLPHPMGESSHRRGMADSFFCQSATGPWYPQGPAKKEIIGVSRQNHQIIKLILQNKPKPKGPRSIHPIQRHKTINNSHCL